MPMLKNKNNFEGEMKNFVSKQPMSGMKKIFWVALVLVVVILFIAGAWFNSNLKAKKYSVVYLSSGELYVGHLRTFPKLVLTDAYMLENSEGLGKDGKPTPIQTLISLTNAKRPWASNKLYLNRDQILFHGYLMEGTEIDKTIKSKAGGI